MAHTSHAELPPAGVPCQLQLHHAQQRMHDEAKPPIACMHASSALELAAAAKLTPQGHRR